MPRTDFDLVCVGGGPAGTGPLVAAARQGLLGEWRVAVVEQSEQLCSGALAHYELESTSRASTFLEAVQGSWSARAAQSGAAEALRTYGDGCVPLAVVARFLAELGRDLCDVVNIAGRVFTRTEALSVQSTASGFAVHVRNSEGESMLTTRRVLLALGGAPRPLPSATTTADAILRGEQSERVQHAVVIGGAHSAFAAARRLLRSARTVTLVLRSRLRLFADSESAARIDGIVVEPEDVCPRTGRVHRFGGLRFRERELALDVLSGREPRVTLLQTHDPRVAEHLSRADQVINAAGYVAREIPIVGPQKGIVRMGLGSGFRPTREYGGEPSYQGPIDGVWLYQHPLGDSVLRELREVAT
ncbi:MAG TPA: FAD-dependent oxidoreductase [Polyangiaceae bacterium]|nr:FAD-dependent oxidoreductase [Polyangiaceae bacterium]